MSAKTPFLNEVTFFVPGVRTSTSLFGGWGDTIQPTTISDGEMGRGAAFSEGVSPESSERYVAGALSAGTPVTGRTVLLPSSLVIIKVDKRAASESCRPFSSIPPRCLLGNVRHALLLPEVATWPDVAEDGP